MPATVLWPYNWQVEMCLTARVYNTDSQKYLFETLVSKNVLLNDCLDREGAWPTFFPIKKWPIMFNSFNPVFVVQYKILLACLEIHNRAV